MKAGAQPPLTARIQIKRVYEDHRARIKRVFLLSVSGRAAAIAYAREGADVAISYYPTEEPDAREVIALIKVEGRKAIPTPVDLRQESYCKELVAKAVDALYHCFQHGLPA